MADLPTGTVTFLFTDVQGSTRLWEQAPISMWEAMARHDALVEGCVDTVLKVKPQFSHSWGQKVDRTLTRHTRDESACA